MKVVSLLNLRKAAAPIILTPSELEIKEGEFVDRHDGPRHRMRRGRPRRA